METYSSRTRLRDNPAIAIAAMALLGCGAAVCIAWLTVSECESAKTFACDAVKQSPPWLLCSAIAAAPCVLLTWYWRDKGRRITEEQKRADILRAAAVHELDREAKVAQRFVTAANLLTQQSKDPVARIAGLHALWDIARESAAHRSTISKTMAAYIRVNAENDDFNPSPEEDDFPAPPTPDVQVALSLVFDHAWEEWLPQRVVDLRRTDLGLADLSRLRLMNADLSYARLAGAEMVAADLRGTKLRRAFLAGANLTGAQMGHSFLADACLDEANLSYVDFSGAQLLRTTFRKANLRSADFAHAVVSKIQTEGANIEGAILHKDWPQSESSKSSAGDSGSVVVAIVDPGPRAAD